MKGDIYDMSERSRHAILKWYLIYRKNPAAIGGYRVTGAQSEGWFSIYSVSFLTSNYPLISVISDKHQQKLHIL